MRSPVLFPSVRGVCVAAAMLLALPAIAAEDPVDAQAAEVAEERFDITEYRVLGNTSLPVVVIERAVYGFLGPDRSITDVQAAREKLESAYREAGFGTVFVDIPEQQVDSGVVRLQVTEGRLDRVRVAGARYFSNRRILAELPSLARGKAPKLPDVQAELAAVNAQTPDLAVTPVLRAGRTPGTVDVELKVADALPLHGSVDVNDMYTADTSRLRMSAGMSFDNLFRRRHSLSLQFQVAPEDPDETRALIASYSFRVPALRGTSFALYAVDSHSDIAAVGTLSVRGNGQIFGARMNRTLQATPRYYSALTLGLDYKDFLEDIRLEDSPGLVTPISYLNWSLEYTGTLRGSDGGCSTTFSTGANFGLRGLFNETREFADKRFLGRPNYFTVTAGMQQLCPLFRHTQLFARVAGQYTPDALVSNEQVSIGGAATVRGYAESAALGDYGGSASLELRNDWIVKPLGLAAGQAYFLGFVEYGAVAIHDPLPSQDRATGLGSFGVGLRVNAWHGLDAAFDWAWAASSWTTVERGDGRAHFRLRYSF